MQKFMGRQFEEKNSEEEDEEDNGVSTRKRKIIDAREEAQKGQKRILPAKFHQNRKPKWLFCDFQKTLTPVFWLPVPIQKYIRTFTHTYILFLDMAD